ncbi:putative dolichyl pyrophosphate Glc1Man9GlcNAc2 alpha-1,3-glucosyltransferase [Pseudolycoriella hygida]|uniref:Alpha-1,3-glucosyltransferase n=1 Tax=Pseudolycoriella hygida TaxID=35572 RepID=A0A9Q0MSD0_9DIPT|nr:putative dolichyl pyrophosphate Glc1Man9GlcNAc2 alpha-1,3-glucosyltransferase [Pseudolycoriella hygida]
MLEVKNLNYANDMTITFMRLSVIISDIVYAFGVKSCIDVLCSGSLKRNFLTYVLLGNVGLFFVDHIHFQYNGIMFGILLLSISKMCHEKYLQSAFFFAMLLHMKHIFIYVSPAYIVYLLKCYCIRSESPLRSLIKLGSIVIAVTITSFGPFYNQMPQVIARLFPFKRGLCHAYWAPNFWTLYNVMDKAASKVFAVEAEKSAMNTGGLVQEFHHLVLPSIKPITTFILTFLAILPCILKLVFIKFDKQSTHRQFIQSIVLCACTSFMFGWHVHEKAILMVLIPLSLLSTSTKNDATATFFLSLVGSYSLFPLLFNAELTMVKALFLISFITLFYIQSGIRRNLKIYEFIYGCGFIFVFWYEQQLQYIFALNERLPFLPLLITSVYCSIGVTYFWLIYYFSFLFPGESLRRQKIK